MTDLKGPITVVSGKLSSNVYSRLSFRCSTGKSRRLTLIECPNELGAIVDIAKIADLVLLMIDGSFGFEMVCSRELQLKQFAYTSVYPLRKPLKLSQQCLHMVCPKSLRSLPT